jgi:hypothetical protein
VRDALIGSLGRLAIITPELCVDYLDAWRADVETWRTFIKGLPRAPSVPQALNRLAAPKRPPLNAVHLRPQISTEQTGRPRTLAAQTERAPVA